MGYFVSILGQGSALRRKEVQILSLTAARFPFRLLLLNFFERCRKRGILLWKNWFESNTHAYWLGAAFFDWLPFHHLLWCRSAALLRSERSGTCRKGRRFNSCSFGYC
jgi:hypothetical protein